MPPILGGDDRRAWSQFRSQIILTPHAQCNKLRSLDPIVQNLARKGNILFNFTVEYVPDRDVVVVVVVVVAVVVLL